jgi:beta-lactamase class D
MMKHLWLLISILLLLPAGWAQISQTPSKESNKEINLTPFFKGYEGAFVLLDLERKSYVRYRPEQCAERMPPMSTFKIPNSLISLELGVVPDARQITKWDGTDYGNPGWNRNHNLASAFASSAVWYYQGLAEKVGAERMREYVRKIHYGNQDISGGITKFWLNTSLKISADEQVEFLRRFVQGELPFSARTMKIVKEIMIVDKNGRSVLRGKTGSAGTNNRRLLNWFVGYLEREGNHYIFATNIKSDEIPDRNTARQITEAILKEMKLWSPSASR